MTAAPNAHVSQMTLVRTGRIGERSNCLELQHSVCYLADLIERSIAGERVAVCDAIELSTQVRFAPAKRILGPGGLM